MPILFATVLIDLIGFGIIIPILPFMAPTLGATHFDIALLIAIYSIFGGLVGPWWGRLSDRIGRKPVLLICLAGAAGSYLLLAFSTTLTMLYLSRALGGVMAGNFGVASAMVADLTPPQERARSMGMIGAAFGLGMVAGPLLGGLLSPDGHNFMLPGLVAAGLSTTAMLAGLLFLPESLPAGARADHARHRAEHGDGGSTLQMLRKQGSSLLVAQYFLNNSCHSSVSFLFPLWVGSMLGWGPKEVGLVFGAQGIAMALMQAGLIGQLVRRIGELGVLLLGSALLCGGFAVAALASGSLTILSGFFCAISGGTLCTPVLNALVANRTPVQLRGRMLGTTSASAAFGRVFGPLFAGTLLSLFNFHIAWIGGCLIAGLMASWAISQLRQPMMADTLTAGPGEPALITGDNNGG